MESKWSYQKCYICPKCSATCLERTSSTPLNPNRQFYKCPKPAHDHNFFKWASDVDVEELIDVPNCGGCSAGICQVRRVKGGPNKGRILFMCRVKEGEGSCGYRVWKDELEEFSAMGRQDEMITSFETTLTNCKDVGPAKTDLVEESRQNDEGADDESFVIDSSRHLEGLPATPWKM